MPYYYFHLFNDLDVQDPEGRELASDGDARAVAIDECRDLMMETVREGHIDLNHRIEVEDINHITLFSVTFADAVELRAA